MTLPLSVVVEMENLRKTDPRRTEGMFAILREQAAELGAAVEIIILHDPDDVAHDEVTARLARAGFNHDRRARIHATPGLRYYQLKNAGAALARGEIVQFLDCDLLPEPGFLRSMLGAFADPAVEVVAGSPYIDPCDTVLEKSFALFFCPLRPERGPLKRVRLYQANSVAFRRELFLAFPFPDSDAYRRQCVMQANALLAAGHQLWGNPDAGVRHPAPYTWGSALTRAICEGRDRYFDRQQRGQRPATPGGAVRGMRRSMRDVGERIRADAARVGLSGAELPGALAIAAGYELAVRAGFVATWIDPRLTPSR